MQKVGESAFANVAFAIQRHYWGNQRRIGESVCARNVAAMEFVTPVFAAAGLVLTFSSQGSAGLPWRALPRPCRAASQSASFRNMWQASVVAKYSSRTLQECEMLCKAAFVLMFTSYGMSWLVWTAFPRPCRACMQTQSVAVVHHMRSLDAFAARTFHFCQCAVSYGSRGRMPLSEVIHDMVVKVRMGRGRRRPSHGSRGSER